MNEFQRSRFHRKTRAALSVLLFVAICFCFDSVRAQEDGQKSESQVPNNFEQLEVDSISFVQEHHAELVTLLKSLKVMRQKEYEVAIRDIGRTKKRLESLTKREPELQGMELEAWKLKSQIDLLLAKGIARDKSFDKKVLRELIGLQIENQKKRWKHEQATLTKRQEQLAEQLANVEGHENEKIDLQLSIHLKSVDNKIGKAKKSKQDAKPINLEKE